MVEYEYVEEPDFYNRPSYLLPPKEEEREPAEIGIIREMSPTKVLEDLRKQLKGFVYDYEEKKWIRMGEALMNDKGIGKYLAVMSSVITPLLTFSKYDEEEIKNWTLYVCEKTIPTIYVNYKEYGIQSKSDLNLISTQIPVLTISAFKKAVGAGDRNLIRGTVSEQMMNRAGNFPMQQQKPGFWQRINPFYKGG